MKRLSILFSMFLIIAISGCIGDGVTPIVSTKDGVIITDFSFEHSPVYAEDYVGLRLEVQNIGGSEATLTKIQVYGVDFIIDSPSTEREWRILGEEVQEVNIPLGRPDPDVNTEGDIDYYEWRLQAPKVAAETDYDFRVRVEYDYETTYSGTIRVIKDDYLRTLNEGDRQKLFDTSGIVSSELTGGPISVTPFASRHFIVTSDDSGDRKIKFKIENVGRGYTSAFGQKYHIELVDVNPKPGEPDFGVIARCNNDNPDIKLSSGKSHIIECDFDLPTGVANKIDKPFQIEFSYSYYVDGSASIAVKPAY